MRRSAHQLVVYYIMYGHLPQGLSCFWFTLTTITTVTGIETHRGIIRKASRHYGLHMQSLSYYYVQFATCLVKLGESPSSILLPPCGLTQLAVQSLTASAAVPIDPLHGGASRAHTCVDAPKPVRQATRRGAQIGRSEEV